MVGEEKERESKAKEGRGLRILRVPLSKEEEMEEKEIAGREWNREKDLCFWDFLKKGREEEGRKWR